MIEYRSQPATSRTSAPYPAHPQHDMLGGFGTRSTLDEVKAVHKKDAHHPHENHSCEALPKTASVAEQSQDAYANLELNQQLEQCMT